MSYKTLVAKKVILPFGAVLLLLMFMAGNSAHAENLIDRKLAFATSEISAVTIMEASFTYTTLSSTGSVLIQFCEESPLFTDPCTVPAGFDSTGAALTSQTGEIGYALDASTNGNLILGRLASVVAATPSIYNFTNITNPSAPGTYYARISSHTSSDATGPRIDEGGIAFAVRELVSVTAFVPPALNFCVGIVISGTNCTTATGSNINFGELSADNTVSATSQMVISTNAFGGYSISTIGNTLTSGNFIIPSDSTPAVSSVGVSQFGLNLVSNSTPNIGNNPVGPGLATPTADYSNQNRYKFENGDTVVSTINSNDLRKFTVSYITNIEEDQRPGTYSTTISYFAIATF